MPFTLPNLGVPQRTSSSRMHAPANMGAIKSAIRLGHVEAVRENISEEGLTCEAWHALGAHVFDSSSAPVVKEALQQVLADAALKHAVRANDIDTARQALLCGAGPEGIPAHAVADDNMRALLTYARRKNKLYPPNGSHGPETALDRALRNGLEERDRQTAMVLLRQAVGNKKIREAWRDAVKGKQVDIQRAILLLGYPDQDRGFRLLQEDAVTDPGVTAVMKEIPYFSPKRGWPRSFNCQATFPGTNKEIACCHIVEHRQAELEQSDRRKFDYVQYASVQNIAAHVSDTTEAQCAYLKAHAAETHLFHNHDFGQVLVGQFGEMQRRKETTRLLLLESSEHAMSVELKVKDKDGKLHYVAALFDPNATTSHIRFASGDMRTLEELTLKGFIESESTYEYYYENSDETSIMFVRPPAPAQAQAEPAREKREAGAVKNRTLTSCINGEQINAIALYFMLANGFSGDIRRLRNEIAKRPEEEQIRILAAKRADGVSGFNAALYYGHADVITAFGEVLKELRVPPADRIKLLEAKGANGVPGFYDALRDGHADAITAFGQVLMELQVPPDKCVELLAAKSDAGVPGLSMALEYGHADAIKAYGQVLKELQVPPDKCVELLEAKDHYGVPGFYDALQQGHADAIKAFCQVLKELQVPPAKCAELLAPKGDYGDPGLYMALWHGYADAITAFVQGLKELKLSSEECVELLEAKDANGVPGFYEVLKNGNAKAIAAFGDAFEELSVPPAKCLELLAVKDANGVPGFYWILKNRKLEAEKQYMEIVRKISPKLHDEQRAVLQATLDRARDLCQNEKPSVLGKRHRNH